MDTLGLILHVAVHAANVQDRDGAKQVIHILSSHYCWLKLIWADGAYAGKLIAGVPTSDATERSPCWIVERAFAWLSRSRRLSKDYEPHTDSVEAMISRIMLRRISR